MPVQTDGKSQAGAFFELTSALAKHTLGRVLLVGAGFYCFLAGAYAGLQGAENWPSMFVAGVIPIGVAMWGRWKQRRNESKERRGRWVNVFVLGGMVVSLGLLALVLIARRKQAVDLAPLTAGEVERLALAEARR